MMLTKARILRILMPYLALLLCTVAGTSHSANYYQCWSQANPAVDYGVHALSPPALWNKISQEQGRQITDAKYRELCGPTDFKERTQEDLIACKAKRNEREVAAENGEILCAAAPASVGTRPHGATLYTLANGCGTLDGQEQMWLAGLLTEAIGTCNFAPTKSKSREYLSYSQAAALVSVAQRGATYFEGVTLAKSLGCDSKDLKKMVDQGLDYFVRTADPNAKRQFLKTSCQVKSSLSLDQCRCLAAFARVVDPGIYDHFYEGRELFNEMNRVHPMLSALPLATCGANPSAYYQNSLGRTRR